MVVQAGNNVFWSNVPDHDMSCGIDFDPVSGNLIADPMFCNPEAGDFSLARHSPALALDGGPAGAYAFPGCDDVPVEPTTWSRLKARYR